MVDINRGILSLVSGDSKAGVALIEAGIAVHARAGLNRESDSYYTFSLPIAYCWIRADIGDKLRLAQLEILSKRYYRDAIRFCQYAFDNLEPSDRLFASQSNLLSQIRSIAQRGGFSYNKRGFAEEIAFYDRLEADYEAQLKSQRN